MKLAEALDDMYNRAWWPILQLWMIYVIEMPQKRKWIIFLPGSLILWGMNVCYCSLKRCVVNIFILIQKWLAFIFWNIEKYMMEKVSEVLNMITYLKTIDTWDENFCKLYKPKEFGFCEGVVNSVAYYVSKNKNTP